LGLERKGVRESLDIERGTREGASESQSKESMRHVGKKRKRLVIVVLQNGGDTVVNHSQKKTQRSKLRRGEKRSGGWTTRRS